MIVSLFLIEMILIYNFVDFVKSSVDYFLLKIVFLYICVLNMI